MAEATVMEVNESAPYQGQNGTLYGHWVTMSNGDKGCINKKTPSSVKVGDHINYDKQTMPGKNGKADWFKFKVHSPNYDGGNAQAPNTGTKKQSNSKPNEASFALSYAKDIVVAQIKEGTVSSAVPKMVAAHVTAIATDLYSWLQGADAPVEVPQQQESQAVDEPPPGY